ncbi:caspase family protein [Lentzea aerocolonigenes]|uniref:caspase family protein n=1 Tax=Lentzea aerocolonigenes TaxID=68170 RepID=UPI000696AF8A|nr:caspase family protein [Lentzea aerocolonigenes]
MGRRRALIIANSTYDHEGLSRLRSPAADAEALAEVLGDRQVSEFSVEVVRDETASVVQERVEDLFLEGEPDDVLLLHFSCHGVKSESGELFFAARNTRPNRLGSTAVPADFVRRCMRQSRSRSIVLLLDCCYGGAFSEGVAVRAAGDVGVLSTLSGGRGRAVITASNAMEYAFEGDHLAEDHAPEPSVFTSALVRGLSTGEADRDEDGLISLNELYDYVFERVRQENPNQTPSRDIEMQGELYLARSGRRRIKPAAMPADLAAAVADSNMFTRLGAVAELRSRLSSGNLEVAAGAHLALTRMASTDISSVAGAAAAALSDAMIQPSVSVLRFSTPGSHVVVLGGPPLARAVTVTASEPWIRVALVEDEIQVSLQQAAPESEGRIEISGPTGSAVVSVLSEAAKPVDTPPVARQATVSRPVVPGPPMPAGPAMPAGQSEQAGQRRPVEESPKQPRPDTDALVPRCAAAVLGAAVLLLLAVPSDYRYDDAMLVNRPTLWAYFVSLGLAAVVGGLALLRPRARTAGAGVLVAAGSLALAGLALLLFEPIYSESFAPYGVAYYMGAVGMLLLIGSAFAAVKIVRRVPDASFAAPTPPWHAVVLILCGLAVSAVLAWRAFLLTADDLVWIAGSCGAALGAPVVPWLAARARPAHLAGSMVAVWAVLLVVISAMPFGFATPSFLIIVPVLVVVGLTAARRQLL